MSRIEAVISDFGGVLTSPMVETFASVQEESGISLEMFGAAMYRAALRDGQNPLAELECGRITEREFMQRLRRELRAEHGLDLEIDGFGERLFARLRPNEELFDFMRSLRDRGTRLALLTNNVREWESRWRRMLPIDEIFEVVVDSAFVGMRKPDREIYELTLERVGLPPEACLFVDDLEPNVVAARELGMTAIHFENNAQAIAAIESALVDGGVSRR